MLVGESAWVATRKGIHSQELPTTALLGTHGGCLLRASLTGCFPYVCNRKASPFTLCLYDGTTFRLSGLHLVSI